MPSSFRAPVPHPLPGGFVPPSIDLPGQFSGIVQSSPDGKPVLSHDLSLPTPGPDQFVIKNIAVAINPCDWKMPTYFPSPGARVGCDFHGQVVAIGPKARATRPDIQLGDRVSGGIHGSNPIDHESGSFSNYLCAHADLVVKVPPDYPDDTVGTLSATSICTLALVWKSMGLAGRPTAPLTQPDGAKQPAIPHILVYGGSTATGTAALQLLRLSGYKPITTCSPRNFDLVRHMGAEAAFDYNSSTCAADIKTYTGNSLRYVLDVITDGTSQTICHSALGRAGGRYAALESPSPTFNARPRTVRVDFVVGLCALGKEVKLTGDYYRPADHACRKQAGGLFAEVQQLVDEGKVSPHPQRLLAGGYQGVLEGIELLRKRAVSGEKLFAMMEG